MQIRIEIDVKPEELRRFLGLPDVAGLQEDVIQFLREKVGAASESFDPTTFVRDNLQTLRRSAAWRKIVGGARLAAHTAEPAVPTAAPPPPKGRARRKPSAGKSSGPRARAKRGTTTSSEDAA